MGKTKIGVFEGEIYWARVFPGNMDDSEYHKATEGQYNCMFVPKDEEELQKMLRLGFLRSLWVTLWSVRSKLQVVVRA